MSIALVRVHGREEAEMARCKEWAMLFLLVKLPDGTMTVRRESEENAKLFLEDGRYVMPNGKEGVVVQQLGSRGDYDPTYDLLREISDMVLVTDDTSGIDPMEALGSFLHEVRAHAGSAERDKWMKEKTKLLSEFNETTERLLRNQSKCVLLFQESLKREKENEKLRRKHKRATLWVRLLVGLIDGIDQGIIVKRLNEMGLDEVLEFVPPKNSDSQPAPPAIGEGNTPPDPDPKSVETEG